MHMSPFPIVTTIIRGHFVIVKSEAVIHVLLVHHWMVDCVRQQKKHVKNHQNWIARNGHIVFNTNTATPAQCYQDGECASDVVVPTTQTKAHNYDCQNDNQNICKAYKGHEAFRLVRHVSLFNQYVFVLGVCLLISWMLESKWIAVCWRCNQMVNHFVSGSNKAFYLWYLRWCYLIAAL